MAWQTGRSAQSACRWEQVTDAHATVIWAEICATNLSEQACMEVNRLTWMRLADHFEAIDHDLIGDWLVETVRRECRRSQRLVGPTPENAPG